MPQILQIGKFAASHLGLYCLPMSHKLPRMQGFINDAEMWFLKDGVRTVVFAISRWEIAYIVDQDQNVRLNRPPTSDFRRT